MQSSLYRSLVHHVVTVLFSDTENIRFVFAAVKDTILQVTILIQFSNICKRYDPLLLSKARFGPKMLGLHFGNLSPFSWTWRSITWCRQPGGQSALPASIRGRQWQRTQQPLPSVVDSVSTTCRRPPVDKSPHPVQSHEGGNLPKVHYGRSQSGCRVWQLIYIKNQKGTERLFNQWLQNHTWDWLSLENLEE